MKAFILAAGFGTRLLPYSSTRPKPLFTLNRRPVLDLAVERLQRAGFNTIIINTHYYHEKIAAFLSTKNYTARVRVRFEPDILGTAGAVRNIADLWQAERDAGPLLIINADIITDIDPAQVYDFHCRHPHPVTMVMHDHVRFNSVSVGPDGFVTGFGCKDKASRDERLMAFTGIHVIDTKVLSYIPSCGAAHIIDIYTAMLANGEQIKSWQPHRHYWQDIGTPRTYRAAAIDCMSPLAFKKAFGAATPQPPSAIPLKGDGSDRKWFRLFAGNDSLIMVDHGIRDNESRTCEVDAFVSIGRHLAAAGAAVPKIYLYDEFVGLVFLEDLGDTHLHDLAGRLTPAAMSDTYRHVIDSWAHMAIKGYQNFNPAWTHQTPRYDRQVILENECRYFVEAFVQNYLGLPLDYETLAEEFGTLAELALSNGLTGFMHRDLQSRNIMIRDNEAYFIDFQGGRLGPLQYDLAALLIDPYVALHQDLQDELQAYAGRTLAARHEAYSRQAFTRGYEYCAMCRNLQILGAFAFLNRVKKKRHFEAYIPQAINSLAWRLANRIHEPLPKLRHVVASITDAIGPGPMDKSPTLQYWDKSS